MLCKELLESVEAHIEINTDLNKSVFDRGHGPVELIEAISLLLQILFILNARFGGENRRIG